MEDLTTKPESIIVVSLDGWNGAFLGPYGATWFETPFLDRFAAAGTVFERVLTTTCDPLESLLRCWTDSTGRFRFPTRPGSAWTTRLITDDVTMATLGRKLGFEKVALSRLSPPGNTAPDEIDDTRAFQDVAHALGVLESEGLDGLTWIHWQGPAALWDAPLDLREQLRDEEDPPASLSVLPPTSDSPLPNDVGELDDYRFTQQTAYAAQIQVWDAALQFLFESLDALGLATNSVKVITAIRGFSLGDHGRFGLAPQLCSDMLQLPLLVMHRDDSQAIRTQRLTRLDELGVTLENLALREATPASVPGDPLQEAIEDAEASGVPAICAASDSHLAIRTDAWFLRHTPDKPAELFMKPDDRFEQIDVADRLPETTDRLVELLISWDNEGRPRAPLWLRESLPEPLPSD